MKEYIEELKAKIPKALYDNISEKLAAARILFGNKTFCELKVVATR